MGKIRFIYYGLTITIIFSLMACSSNISTNAQNTQPVEILPSEINTKTFVVTEIPTQTVTATITPTPGIPGFCEQTGALNGKQLLIGYIPDYRTLEPEWGNCLTDIIYSSVDFLPDGSLNLEHINTSNLTTMQEIKGKYGTRIHISLGGMGRSENFSAVVTNVYRRSQFVENLQNFANKYQIDGIDLDWEFPQSEQEISGYIALMKALQAKGFIVSVALYPYPDFDILPYLSADRILIMSYERGKKHSTYEQAVKDLVYFSSLGVPKKNLFLGIPMYGRQMDSPYRYFAYNEIVEKYGPVRENVNEIDGIYFNNVNIVEKKTCFAINNGYGGIMLWELGQDNGTLLQTINRAIVSGCNQ